MVGMANMKYNLKELRRILLKRGILILSYDSLHHKTFSLSQRDLIPIIIEFIKNTSDEFLKYHCITSLGVKGFDEASDFLKKLYVDEINQQSQNYEIALNIAETLYRIRNKNDYDWFCEQLSKNELTFETINFAKALPEIHAIDNRITNLFIKLSKQVLVLPSAFYRNPLEENKYFLSLFCLKKLSKIHFDGKDEFAGAFLKHLNEFIRYEKSEWAERLSRDTIKEYKDVLLRFDK